MKIERIIRLNESQKTSRQNITFPTSNIYMKSTLHM